MFLAHNNNGVSCIFKLQHYVVFSLHKGPLQEVGEQSRLHETIQQNTSMLRASAIAFQCLAEHGFRILELQ